MHTWRLFGSPISLKYTLVLESSLMGKAKVRVPLARSFQVRTQKRRYGRTGRHRAHLAGVDRTLQVIVAREVVLKQEVSYQTAQDEWLDRITPVLIKPGPIYTETVILTYATTQTQNAAPKIELGRQLLIGSIYAFEINAFDKKGRVSSTVRSQDIQL